MDARAFRRAFPMPNATAAWLMALKAACLYRAHLLTSEQKAEIDRRASEQLSRDEQLSRESAAVERASGRQPGILDRVA